MHEQNGVGVAPSLNAPTPNLTSLVPPRATARARTTPAPPPLLDQALDELATCLASLRLAEEVIRVQNVALKKCHHARHIERRQYLDLFASVPDALLVTDANGLILEANPAAARLLSGSERLRAGKFVARFFTHDSQIALVGVLEAAGCGAGWEGGLWIKPRLGLAFFASVTTTPVAATRDAPPALRWLIRPA